MDKIYTGVGSRKTPNHVQHFFKDVARRLNAMGFTLRSGAASGADAAFQSGSIIEQTEIWIPWKGFNGVYSDNLPSDAAFTLASSIHPAWNRLSDGAKKLHARNCHQVLGRNLDTPSTFLLCWTEYGKAIGGTATAIKLALNNNVPVLNFGKWTDTNAMNEALQDFLILNGEI